MGWGHVAISLSLPQQDRNAKLGEVESPRACNERHIPHGSLGSLSTGFLKAGDEAVSNFRSLLHEAAIRLRKCSSHPFAAALPTATYRAQVKPE